MPRGVRVFGGVPVRRVVAAVRAAASLARPQVHPTGINLDTLITSPMGWTFDLTNRVDVFTARHGGTPMGGLKSAPTETGGWAD